MTGKNKFVLKSLTMLNTEGVAAAHSGPRQYIGVSGQRHAPAALYPRGKDPRYPLYRRLGGP
jgi:hypothetical protein